MKFLSVGYVCDALWPVKIWLPPPLLDVYFHCTHRVVRRRSQPQADSASASVRATEANKISKPNRFAYPGPFRSRPRGVVVPLFSICHRTRRVVIEILQYCKLQLKLQLEIWGSNGPGDPPPPVLLPS